MLNPDATRGQSRTLGRDHTLGGNPMRELVGDVPIRLDEEWLTAMSAPDRRVVTAVSLPGLLRYGYLRRPPDSVR